MGFTYQVVELDGRDSLVDARDDLLSDGSSVDMFRIETIAQSRHTCSDLVELHAFFASVYTEFSRQFAVQEWRRWGSMSLRRARLFRDFSHTIGS